jgi:NADPH:quinone reductase-like Zn-dependent oxidoreductase
VVVAGDGTVGQPVFGSGAGFGVSRDGTHAEYVVAPADALAPKPANLSMEQAACVGVPYTVAWWSLIHAARLQTGETALIVGVSGAVGRAATQIVHRRKGRVIGADRGSANPSGADVLIDTMRQDIRSEVRAATGGKGADVVLNAVGGALFEPALLSLRNGGRYVVIASVGEPRVSFNLMDFYHNQAHLIGVDSIQFTAQQIAGVLREATPGFEAGEFVLGAIRTWPLDQGIAAYEAAAQGGAPVKHVLRMG